MPKGYFQGESVASDRLLYTPSEFARSNLLYLQEIGHLRALKPHTSRRQNLDSFLFFRVKSGSGILGYGGQEYTLHAGDCVFIHCKEPYFHRTGEGVYKSLSEATDSPWKYPFGMNEILSLWANLII